MTEPGHFILSGREIIPTTVEQWAAWFVANSGGRGTERRVAWDDVDGVRISTVFVGLDNSFGEGPPELFETMVFEDDSWNESLCWSYATYDEAEAGHSRAVELVKRARAEGKSVEEMDG